MRILAKIANILPPPNKNIYHIYIIKYHIYKKLHLTSASISSLKFSIRSADTFILVHPEYSASFQAIARTQN